MSEVGIFRWETSCPRRSGRWRLAAAGPVTLFNDDLEGSEARPKAYTDVRISEARHLAVELLNAAEDAERQPSGELVSPRGAGISAPAKTQTLEALVGRTLASCTCLRAAPGSAAWSSRPRRE